MQPQPPTALHICELCMDLQALLQPRGNITGIQVFTPYTTRDGIHNACLGFDASYIHLKTILSQAFTISLTLYTVLMPTPSRLEQQSVHMQDLLHMHHGFLPEGGLWLHGFMFE